MCALDRDAGLCSTLLHGAAQRQSARLRTGKAQVQVLPPCRLAGLMVCGIGLGVAQRQSARLLPGGRGFESRLQG